MKMKAMREVWAECVLADELNELRLLESDEPSGTYLFQIKKKIPWEIGRNPNGMYENVWYAVWHGEQWEVVMSYQTALAMYEKRRKHELYR